jgi:hypothetical protein
VTDATSSEKLPAAEDYVFGPKFNALRCAIYHTERRNFFDLSNRCLNFLVIIFGAGVAGKAAKLIHVEELLLELGVLVFATAHVGLMKHCSDCDPCPRESNQ